MPALNELHEQYGEQAAFWMVYIEEAHASDVWQAGANEREEILISNHRDINERNAAAQSCVRKLGIEFPAIVDDFENSTERAYSGWPDRLYVIDEQGRVAFKSAAGPYGFKPDGVEQTLERLLGTG